MKMNEVYSFMFLFSPYSARNAVKSCSRAILIRSDLVFPGCIFERISMSWQENINKKSNSQSHRGQKHFSSTFGQISRAITRGRDMQAGRYCARPHTLTITSASPSRPIHICIFFYLVI